MKTFKFLLGVILLTIAAILGSAIDNLSLLGVIVAAVIIIFSGKAGIHLIEKYSEPENID